MAEKTDETYDPSTLEVDRGREQGLGMGERDIKRQRDPGTVERNPETDADDEEDTGDGFGRAKPVA